jgi:hypothetical protein
MRVFEWKTHMRNESDFGGIFDAPSTGQEKIKMYYQNSKKQLIKQQIPILIKNPK